MTPRIHLREETMTRHLTIYSTALLLGASALLSLPSAHGFSSSIEPVVWNSQQKSAAWAEELLGQVVTYQTMAEKA